MKYTIDYFIKKFTKIPNSKWTVGDFIDSSGKSCALGHCGWCYGNYETEEGLALIDLFSVSGISSVAQLNDGGGSYNTYGKTPRTRILRALKNLKKEVK